MVEGEDVGAQRAKDAWSYLRGGAVRAIHDDSHAGQWPFGRTRDVLDIILQQCGRFDQAADLGTRRRREALEVVNSVLDLGLDLVGQLTPVGAKELDPIIR